MSTLLETKFRGTAKDVTPFQRGDLVSKIGMAQVYVFDYSENGVATVYGIRLSEAADSVINVCYVLPTDQLVKREMCDINVDGALWLLMRKVKNGDDIWCFDKPIEIVV